MASTVRINANLPTVEEWQDSATHRSGQTVFPIQCVGSDIDFSRAHDGGGATAALLTQRLLAFSRQTPLQPEAVDANKLVAGMSDLLRHSLGGDVRLETVRAGGLWQIHADPNQLGNVILNLAINGRDAMGHGGGRLTIETANCRLDDQ